MLATLERQRQRQRGVTHHDHGIMARRFRCHVSMFLRVAKNAFPNQIDISRNLQFQIGVNGVTSLMAVSPMQRSHTQFSMPIPSDTIRMNKLLLLSPLLLLVAAQAAFVTTQPARTSLLKRHLASVDWIQESNVQGQATEPTSTDPWVKKSRMYQAVECAGDECDVNEVTYHLSSLMQLDDECLFHQAFESEPTMECSNTQDRHLVQRILQLQSELHSLQKELKENEFVNAIKKQHEDELQNHWYNDYLEFYHM